MTILDFLSTDTPVFTWVVLPILIFCARIFDQSVGTLRLIFIAKGLKKWAPVFAFFESLIWLLAIGEIIKHLDNPLCYIAYAGGFAMGNYVGMLLDEKISLGNVIIRVILKNQAPELIAHLKESHYGITILDAEGSKGKVKVIFSIIKRKDVNDFIAIINELNPQSFYTIEEIRSVNEGVFKTSSRKHLLNLHFHTKKHK